MFIRNDSYITVTQILPNYDSTGTQMSTLLSSERKMSDIYVTVKSIFDKVQLVLKSITITVQINYIVMVLRECHNVTKYICQISVTALFV